MRIAVYGAGGYTGKLVVAELVRRTSRPRWSAGTSNASARQPPELDSPQ
ncbi:MULTISPECIES: hypothetical protein [unclassified Streptomyces]|nr:MULTISPECIES: hypothetical protein [unclassified Streptomyces]